jgi:class 3 adenylate cyclase
MSIRIKLALALAVLGAGAALISGYIAYRNASESLTRAVWQEMRAVRRARAQQVEAYLRTVELHVDTLSEARNVVDAVEEFRVAFGALNRSPVDELAKQGVTRYYRDEFVPRLGKPLAGAHRVEDFVPRTPGGWYLQSRYLARMGNDLSAYGRVHARHDASFRKITDRFGYEDLLLVDHETGQVVYSTGKAVDYATNLLNGPYKGTGAAKAFRLACASTGPDDVVIADFERYAPALGTPQAFVSTTINDGPRRVGVLIMQLSTTELDNAVTGFRNWERDGLGQSGDTWIVGPDLTMRSNARRAEGATTILRKRVDAALLGEGLVTLADGRRVVVSGGPLNVAGLNWKLTSWMDADEALAPVERMRNKTRLWGFVVALLMTLIGVAIANVMVRPLRELVDGARALASGQLEARVEVRSRDELGLLSAQFNSMASSLARQTEELKARNRENESLLLNILPGPIALRLKSGEQRIADAFPEVTVLFADIVGFTVISGESGAEEVVQFLNLLFTRFDELARKHGVEKIKTIGDCYMAVCGLPVPEPEHARRMAAMALDMVEATRRFSEEYGKPFAIRVGLNTGPVVAGVIGATKFIYDLWGDTVNVASRMESHGIAGEVQVTRTVYEALGNDYGFEPRGEIEVKGKGRLEAWLLRRP